MEATQRSRHILVPTGRESDRQEQQHVDEMLGLSPEDALEAKDLEAPKPKKRGRQSIPKSGRSEQGGERNFGVIFPLNRGFLL